MLDIRNFLAEATLNATVLDRLNDFVNTYINLLENNSPKFTIVTQEVFLNFFPCVYVYFDL